MTKWISEYIGYIVYGCFTFILSCLAAGWVGHHVIQQRGCSNSLDAIMNSGGPGLVVFFATAFIFGVVVPFALIEIGRIRKEIKEGNHHKFSIINIFKNIVLFLKVICALLLVLSFIFGLVWLSGKLLQLIFC